MFFLRKLVGALGTQANMYRIAHFLRLAETEEVKAYLEVTVVMLDCTDISAINELTDGWRYLLAQTHALSVV